MKIDEKDLIKGDIHGLSSLPSKGEDQILEYLQAVYDLDAQYWVPLSAIGKQVNIGQQRIRTIINRLVEKNKVEMQRYGVRKLYRIIPPSS